MEKQEIKPELIKYTYQSDFEETIYSYKGYTIKEDCTLDDDCFFHRNVVVSLDGEFIKEFYWSDALKEAIEFIDKEVSEQESEN